MSISKSSKIRVALFCALVMYVLQMTMLAAPSFAQSQILDSEPLEITTSRGNFKFSVEIADEPQERTIGLMNRQQLDARGGMLFVFDNQRVVTMWMKNTLISLDMVFVANNGKVIKIAERTIPHSLELISSDVPVAYVLELNGGMADFIGLLPGDQLKHRFFR